MKKILSIVLMAVMCFMCMSCEKKEVNDVAEPKVSQMKAICELSVMDCYYHNVAKYFEEDASGALLWKKDKEFWIEYSGIVRIGIDASQVQIQVEDNNVEITMPKAKVMNCKVDPDSLSSDSFIVASDSAKVEADDQKKAFEEAQKNMEEEASSDSALLAMAQQRAQNLLEEYVKNVGNVVGKQYTITWNYIDDTVQQNNTEKQQNEKETTD